MPSPTTDSTTGGPAATDWRGFAGLSLIVLLAAALRFWELDLESPWWDEFASLHLMDSPSLLEFFRANRILDPAALPLYYGLEYLWWNKVSASVESLRYVSIVLGLGIVVMAYVTGREFFGPRGGLVPALCVALSPIHVFHAQGIRVYVLLCLLALCSLYTFIRLLRDPSRTRWIAHGAVNALLYWTHPFAGLILVVQGLYLLAFHFRPVSFWFRWGAMNVLLALPFIAYMTTVEYFAADETESWIMVPTVSFFLTDVFSDDRIADSSQVINSATRGEFLPAAFQPAYKNIEASMNRLHRLLPLLGLVWAGVMLAGIAKGEAAERRRRRRYASLLLAWLILPPLILFVLSNIWRPCMFPRYTMYSSFALYLLLGSVYAAAPWRVLRLGIVSMVIALLGYQVSLLHPGPQRTDWNSAAAAIEERAAIGDLVVVENNLWKRVFEYSLGATDLTVVGAHDQPEIIDYAKGYLTASTASGSSPAVWLITATNYFSRQPLPELEERLSDHGLQFERTKFDGIKTIFLYELEGEALQYSEEETEKFSSRLRHIALQELDRGRLLSAENLLALAANTNPDGHPLYKSLLDALASGDDYGEYLAAVDAVHEARKFEDEGDLPAALSAYRRATQHDAKNEVAWTEIERIATQEMRVDLAVDAYDALEEIISPPVFALRFEHRQKTAAEGRDLAAALQAEAMANEGLMMLETGELDSAKTKFSAALKIDPDYAMPYLGYALIDLSEENRDAFLLSMEKFYERAPKLARHIRPFITALYVDKNPDAAEKIKGELESAGAGIPTPFLTELEQLRNTASR